MIGIRKKLSRGLRSVSPGSSPSAARRASVPVCHTNALSARPAPLGTVCESLLDDAVLIERINIGDQAAANALIERLRPTILKCIRRRLPRWMDEEDLMQNVLAKVFSHLHQFSGSVPLEHWVSRIAINTSLNQIDYESVRPEFR